ncbi:sigma-54 interaction domain-containing protein [Bythopirellula polymerisocia]|uniref:Transcriptional regulatory protein ZraR n=1 Tax=Bythopirellula polymerisocia TaxID=2528003 RepID=A0A5C6CDA4_9BACT|nr:sigma-54 dependent transcriptional regulator [Bythopirellula polymerisocia]TWU20799.1 Transcriptional regulatory protein ZraR [Bythopirellula polymerisocia]
MTSLTHLRHFAGPEIVGESFATRNLLTAISHIAPYSSTVLITGASGTGKELVARQIHEASPRAKNLFIPVDCASMTGELMSSQLFGHVKGAFTSADQGSLGCFRAADKGTIFLDEIGELPLPLQAKLLRVIQERSVVPVGSHQAIPVNVRILAATNRDLKREMLAGQFREDLYYRLCVVTIRTTPLCERTEDIATLVPKFLDELAAEGHPRQKLTPAALQLLQSYNWPGNVRELKNVLEQAAVETDGEWITEEVFMTVLSNSAGGRVELGAPDASNFKSSSLVDRFRYPEVTGFPQPAQQTWTSLADLERQHIVLTLEHTYHNKSAAARLLSISRQALLRKMVRLGLSG